MTWPTKAHSQIDFESYECLNTGKNITLKIVDKSYFKLSSLNLFIVLILNSMLTIFVKISINWFKSTYKEIK